ncbi:MAG: type I restriction endonuclease, partial [Cyanobium sp.]
MVSAHRLQPRLRTPARQRRRLTGAQRLPAGDPQRRLRSALQRLNPGVPASTIDTAVLQLANPNVPGLLASNRQFHRWLTQGLPITVTEGNQQVGIRLRLIGFDDPAANDWLVVNQLAIQG